MKKIYLQPEIKVVAIHHESPLLGESEYMKIYDQKGSNGERETVEDFEDLL